MDSRRRHSPGRRTSSPAPHPEGTDRLQRISSLGEIRKSVVERLQRQFESIRRRASSEPRDAPSAKRSRSHSVIPRVQSVMIRKGDERRVLKKMPAFPRVEQGFSRICQDFNSVVDRMTKEGENLSLLEQKTKATNEMIAAEDLVKKRAQVEEVLAKTVEKTALLSEIIHLERTNEEAVAVVVQKVNDAKDAMRKYREMVGDKQKRGPEGKVEHEARIQERREEMRTREFAAGQELEKQIARNLQLKAQHMNELNKRAKNQERLRAAAPESKEVDEGPTLTEQVRKVAEVEEKRLEALERISRQQAKVDELERLVQEKDAAKRIKQETLDRVNKKFAIATKLEAKKTTEKHTEDIKKLVEKLQESAGELLEKFLAAFEEEAGKRYGTSIAQELVEMHRRSYEVKKSKVLSMTREERAAKLRADMDEETRAILERVEKKEKVSDSEVEVVKVYLAYQLKKAAEAKKQAFDDVLKKCLDPCGKLLQQITADAEAFLKKFKAAEAMVEANMEGYLVPPEEILLEWVKQGKLNELVDKVIDVNRRSSRHGNPGLEVGSGDMRALKAAFSAPREGVRSVIHENLTKRLAGMKEDAQKLADLISKLSEKLEAVEEAKQLREKSLAEIQEKQEEARKVLQELEGQKQQHNPTIEAILAEQKICEDKIGEMEVILEQNRRRAEARSLIKEENERKKAEVAKKRQELEEIRRDQEEQIALITKKLQDTEELAEVQLREIGEAKKELDEWKEKDSKLKEKLAETEVRGNAEEAELETELMKLEAKCALIEAKKKRKELLDGVQKKRDEIREEYPNLNVDHYKGLTVVQLKAKVFEAHLKLNTIRQKIRELDESAKKRRKAFDKLMQDLEDEGSNVTAAKVKRKMLRARGKALQKKIKEEEAKAARLLKIRLEMYDLRCALDGHVNKYPGRTFQDVLDEEKCELAKLSEEKAVAERKFETSYEEVVGKYGGGSSGGPLPHSAQMAVEPQRTNESNLKLGAAPELDRKGSRKAKQQVRFSSPLEMPTPEKKAEPVVPAKEPTRMPSAATSKLRQRSKSVCYFDDDDDSYEPPAPRTPSRKSVSKVSGAQEKSKRAIQPRPRSKERKENHQEELKQVGKEKVAHQPSTGGMEKEKAKERSVLVPGQDGKGPHRPSTNLMEKEKAKEKSGHLPGQDEKDKTPHLPSANGMEKEKAKVKSGLLPGKDGKDRTPHRPLATMMEKEKAKDGPKLGHEQKEGAASKPSTSGLVTSKEKGKQKQNSRPSSSNAPDKERAKQKGKEEKARERDDKILAGAKERKEKEKSAEKKKQDVKTAVKPSAWKAFDDDDPIALRKGAGPSGTKKNDGEKKKVKQTFGLLPLRNPEQLIFDMSMSDVEPDKEPVIDWSKF